MFRRLALSCATLCAIVLPLGMIGPAAALGYTHPTVVSADPVNSTPHATNGRVLAVATVGDRVYVGGTFTAVTNANRTSPGPRSYLFAYNRTTGQVLPFAPKVNGTVNTIAAAPDGSSIIIGGAFTTVNGATQRSLAMIKADGSRAATFQARTNGPVEKVLVRQNRLVAAGRFTTAVTTARTNLAVFNATTGAVDTAFNLPVTEGRTTTSGTVTASSVVEMDADATGSRLVIVGNFRRVAGQARQQIAVINLATNSLNGWSTARYSNDVSGALRFRCKQDFHTAMRDVELAPGGGYFVVVTTGGAPDFNRDSLCDTAARWETPGAAGTSGARETWFNCTGGDTLLSVAVTAPKGASAGAVYVGGHQRWLDNCGGRDSAVTGSFAAAGIGAIHPVTGKAIRTWNPGRHPRGYGAEELVAQAEGLYVGSDTEGLGGEYHARFGLFPLN